jgi:hypothetical protein
MLVALVALLSSLVGGATAATLITGADIAKKSIGSKHIKKNAVRTKHVKNATLLAEDFKPGQLPAGATGPQGAAGTAGERGEKGEKGEAGTNGTNGTNGATGPRGPSDAISKRNSSIVAITATSAAVLSIDLPAGSWVVNASGVMNNDGGAQGQASCTLDVSGPISSVESNLGSNNAEDRDSFGMTGAATVGSTTPAELRCSISGGSGRINAPSITAIRVETLTLP